MMLGPAPVPAIDATCAASCSVVVVQLLRGRFAFGGGLVISDGLEAAATAAGRSVAVQRGELEEKVLWQATARVEAAIGKCASVTF